MEFSQIIEELGERSSLSGLRLDESGACSVLFDEEHEVEFQCDPRTGAVLFWCAVGSLSDMTEALGRKLLSASAFGAATDGAALGIYEPLEAIVLWQRQPSGFADLEDFTVTLNRVLAQCSTWKRAVKDRGEAPDEQTALPMTMIAV